VTPVDRQKIKDAARGRQERCIDLQEPATGRISMRMSDIRTRRNSVGPMSRAPAEQCRYRCVAGVSPRTPGGLSRQLNG
jgi:hypothetical protein